MSPYALIAVGVLVLAAADSSTPPDQGGAPSGVGQPGRQKSIRPHAPTVLAVRHTSKRPELV
jgi:hypothetical protein